MIVISSYISVYGEISLKEVCASSADLSREYGNYLGGDGAHLVRLSSASEEGLAIERTIRKSVFGRSSRTGTY